MERLNFSVFRTDGRREITTILIERQNRCVSVQALLVWVGWSLFRASRISFSIVSRHGGQFLPTLYATLWATRDYGIQGEKVEANAARTSGAHLRSDQVQLSGKIVEGKKS